MLFLLMTILVVNGCSKKTKNGYFPNTSDLVVTNDNASTITDKVDDNKTEGFCFESITENRRPLSFNFIEHHEVYQIVKN